MTTKNSNLNMKHEGYGAAFWILICFFFFEYIRPQDSFLPFLSYVRIPMFLSLILLAVFLKGDKKILHDKLVILTILFVTEIGFSVIYAVNTTYVWRTFFGMSIVLFAVILVMPSICNSRDKLFTFIKIWLGIHIVVTLYSMFHAGQGPGGFLLDENDLSLALNMVLPIPIYLSLSPNISKSRRLYYRLASLLFIVGVGMTNSRGGFLGLVSVFGLLWLFSENRMKSMFKVLFMCALLAYPVYKLIPEAYINEMSTITNSEDDTRLERIYFWKKGWEMFLDNPILGLGANNYQWNIAHYQLKDPNFDPDTMLLFGGRPAHSLYFALIPELGAVGIILFLMILFELFKKIRAVISIGKQSEEFSDERLLAKAFAVSAITYLVTGAFISVLYYPPFWYLVGFTLTMHTVTCAHKIPIKTDKRQIEKIT